MEIAKAVRDSGNQTLKTKYAKAIRVILDTVAQHNHDRVAFIFTGGNYSIAMLHMIRAALQPAQHITTLYFKDPSALPELKTFADYIAET
ncbi:FAD synthase, partial [Tanacetum coccineum]